MANCQINKCKTLDNFTILEVLWYPANSPKKWFLNKQT